MIAVLTASPAAALLFGGQRLGLTTPIERIYAATVAA